MSVTTVEITTIEQVSNLLWTNEFEEDKKRFRSNAVFRGLPNSTYSLNTSLHRNCKEKSKELEKSLLRNFTKYASIEDESLRDSIWKQMIIGQHHGLPTRLLDWTYSVLIALHFATSGENLDSMDQNDAVVWQIDIQEMNKRLPEKFHVVLKEADAYILTVEMLEEVYACKGYKAIEAYDIAMRDSAMVMVEPPSVDQRIINQYSYFSIVPAEMEMVDKGIEKFLDTVPNTYKYIISKDLKWRIRDMLDQMNISERTAFPGLDGLTQWLKRHYYVRK